MRELSGSLDQQPRNRGSFKKSRFALTSFRQAQRMVVRACGRLVMGDGAQDSLWTSHLDTAAIIARSNRRVVDGIASATTHLAFGQALPTPLCVVGPTVTGATESDAQVWRRPPTYTGGHHTSGEASATEPGLPGCVGRLVDDPRLHREVRDAVRWQ